MSCLAGGEGNEFGGGRWLRKGHGADDFEAAGGGIGEIVSIHFEADSAESLLVSAPFCLETDESVFLVVEFAIDESGDYVNEFELIARSEMLDLHGECFLELDDVAPAGVQLFQMEPDAFGG